MTAGKKKRVTVYENDVFESLNELGFGEYIEEIKKEIEQSKKVKDELETEDIDENKGVKSPKIDNEGKTD